MTWVWFENWNWRFTCDSYFSHYLFNHDVKFVNLWLEFFTYMQKKWSLQQSVYIVSTETQRSWELSCLENGLGKGERNVLTSAASCSVPEGSCYWSMLNPAQWRRYILSHLQWIVNGFRLFQWKHALLHRGGDGKLWLRRRRSKTRNSFPFISPHRILGTFLFFFWPFDVQRDPQLHSENIRLHLSRLENMW